MRDLVKLGIQVKMERARELGDQLQQMSFGYGFSSPAELDVELRRNQEAYVVRVSVRQPPVEIAAILGDYLNNLRSALEYCASLVVLKAGGQPTEGGGGTAFPIPKVKPTLPLRFRPTSFLEADELLNRVQPFDSDPTSGLRLLETLNNQDKHRLLNIAGYGGSADVAFFDRQSSDPTIRQGTTPTHLIDLVDGATALVKVSSREMFDDAVALGGWTSEVTIAHPDFAKPMNLVGVVRATGNEVAAVVDDFVRLSQ